MIHKAIIMAGGHGTRLWPMTLCLNKQLLPVYDKPMIYYPLSTLMSAGIRDILVISAPHDLPICQSLLRDGTQWGINLTYATQPIPLGIAEAFLIGRDFIGHDNVTLILGDNIFYGSQIEPKLAQAINRKIGASIFVYHVQDPERYGVVVFDEKLKPISIEEKPGEPKSNYAVTGLYCYDNQVIDIAKEIRPSKRGELEITDINNFYLTADLMHATILNRGTAWLDTGTCASLLDAAHFIHTIEERQGLKVGCPEEIAWQKGFINDADLEKLANDNFANSYGKYLLNILTHKKFLDTIQEA